MKGLTLIFESKRGGSVVRALDPVSPDELVRILSTLRRPATLELDGEQVGGINWGDNGDDGRVRWQWWYDRRAIEKVGR